MEGFESDGVMTKGQVEGAERRALNILDDWLKVTGAVPIDSGLYFELQGIVQDAVHCGVQKALGVYEVLSSEKK